MRTLGTLRGVWRSAAAVSCLTDCLCRAGRFGEVGWVEALSHTGEALSAYSGVHQAPSAAASSLGPGVAMGVDDPSRSCPRRTRTWRGAQIRHTWPAYPRPFTMHNDQRATRSQPRTSRVAGSPSSGRRLERWVPMRACILPVSQSMSMFETAVLKRVWRGNVMLCVAIRTRCRIPLGHLGSSASQ